MCAIKNEKKKTIVAGWKEVPCALVVTIVVVVTRSSTAAAGFVQGTPRRV